MSDTVTSTAGHDPRVAALFTDKALRLTVTTSLHGPASGSPLSGRFAIARFDALVIAARKTD